MIKTCISFYEEFSNIGPTRRTWLWRLKVKANQPCECCLPSSRGPVVIWLAPFPPTLPHRTALFRQTLPHHKKRHPLRLTFQGTDSPPYHRRKHALKLCLHLNHNNCACPRSHLVHTFESRVPPCLSLDINPQRTKYNLTCQSIKYIETRNKLSYNSSD